MLELVLEYRDDAQRVASLVLGLAMWRWGGGPERAIAAVFVILLTLPVMVMSYLTSAPVIFSSTGALYTALDVLAAGAFVAIALYANRNYPMWIAGFQLVAITAHLVRGVVDAVTPIAYAVMVIGPSYFQLILMLIGLIRHVRRHRKFGDYRDWRVSVAPRFVPILGKGPQ